jgi:spore maturation protein CgeB
MKILCVFGKNAYGDPSRGPGIEYESFIPAIKRLGHEVIFFDSWDRRKYQNFAELNQALLNIVFVERPNIILIVQRLYEIWIETLDILKRMNDVVTIYWATDDSWKYSECSRLIGKYYDGIITTYPGVLSKYYNDGIRNVLLLQWAANAECLQEPLPSSSCVYPVSFIGTAHGSRKKWIKKLANRGIYINCFGYGWENGVIDERHFKKIIRESIISINFANSKGENQIKARTFEVPGYGGFLLTQKAKYIDKYYIDGKEIVIFDNLDDMINKIKYYLAHPNERDKIALAGFQRTKREHTYDKRMYDLINFALSLKKRKNELKNENANKPIIVNNLYEKHRITPLMAILRKILIFLFSAIFGSERGPRAARRFLFELCWRLCKDNVYSSKGIPGRIFYKES